MPARSSLMPALVAFVAGATGIVRAQHAAPPPEPGSFTLPTQPPGRDEAEREARRTRLPTGWTQSIWAAEPDVIHPVSFDITDDGRVFVAESLRAWRGVPDVRNLIPWLDEDIASRSVEDRLAFMRRLWGDAGLKLYSQQSERVRLLVDRNGDGKADSSQVFAEGFNTPLDGVASSVLARGNEVWFANIPDIWWLRDDNGDGTADVRRSLSHGHGVRISMLGHDLHGLTWGPDGRIYVSVGDRASMIRQGDQWIGHPECGVVFRFEEDGSGLEMFAHGLRNPQELVFDDWGNLFSGDNSSNTGDESRWVYIVRGGDSGWRIGWQWAENRTGINDGNWRGGAEGPGANSPWNSEGLWKPFHRDQPAWIVPPIANFSAGPCGNTLYPGTGLDASWDGNFLLTDFRGSSNDSLIWRFRLAPQGAGFTVTNRTEWLRGINATDVAFGPDGALWALDWTDGWEPSAKGRIHRLHPPRSQEPTAPTPTALLKSGFADRQPDELIGLLKHADRRVRQGAQFALARTPGISLAKLVVALGSDQPIASRRHAAWALGQIARKARSAGTLAPESALAPLVPLLTDAHPGIRSVAATVLGDLAFAPARPALEHATTDANAAVRRDAALALASIRSSDSVPALVSLLTSNADQDPFVRHAAIHGLLGCTDAPGLLKLSQHASPSVRRAAVVALRRQERPEIQRFLNDPDELVRAEAARAIHDVPIASALPDLAFIDTARLTEPAFSRRVVNACLRVGSPESAARLVTLARTAMLPESIRVDALAALQAWPTNAGRDRITGLWRPTVFPRSAEVAAQALRPHLAELLGNAPDAVLLEAAVLTGGLRMAEAEPFLADIVRRPLSAATRVRALESLASLSSGRLGPLLDEVSDDPQAPVRATALRLATQLAGPDAVPRLRRVLDQGSPSDQQAALTALARIHNEDSRRLRTEWMERLLAGKAPAPLHLEILEAAESQPDDALQSLVQRYRGTLGSDPIAPFRVALEGGSADAGRGVFSRPEVECIRCHKLYGRGGEVGPELSTIATRLDRLTLLESIVTPDRRLAPGYETLLVTLNDGETVAGISVSEDTSTLTLRLLDGTVQKYDRKRIRSRERGHSAMPSGLAETLGRRQLRDLVEFLTTLR